MKQDKKRGALTIVLNEIDQKWGGWNMNWIGSNKSMCLVVFIIAALAGGCAVQQRHQAGSVVQFLYPDKKEPTETPSIPVLTLPLRVGIAFVPEERSSRSGIGPVPFRSGDPIITEKDRMMLMQEISKDFKKYEFVKSIEVIPSAFLRPKGSFENLDQLRFLLGIDVIALLSYYYNEK